MQQAVIQIGNSIGVIIPKNLRNGLKAGDKVMIGEQKDKITITPIKKTGGVNAKFAKIVDDFINEHEDVLRELAQR